MGNAESHISFSPARRRLALLALLALVVVGAIGFVAFRWAAASARAASAETAGEVARGHSGLLASELQKFRLLPLVLTEYPDVRAALEMPNAATLDRLNRKLEILAGRTDAAVIYVIDRGGMTVAASNWRRPTSFVGHDYGFRPYVRGALRDGAAELFALGTVSGRPGLFIARRIEGPAGPLGVVVAKVEFGAIEGQWARQAGPTFVTDSNGVVIITSRPDWRFRATRPIDQTRIAMLRRTLLYGSEPPAALGLQRGDGLVRAADAGPFVPAEVATPLAGARLHYLQPLGQAAAGAQASAGAAVLAALAAAVLLLALAARAFERHALREESRRALEGEVALRTAELSEANRRLTAESRERERIDRRYRAAREELALANRLAAIGQTISGVVHEIAQPVAAIRTFSDNAQRFLQRGDGEKAGENLSAISDLTMRIGAITSELRSFARRKPPKTGPVELGAAIDGALLLVGDSLRAAGVTLERAGDETILVAADRVRLEQILINLFQNATEALGGVANPRLTFTIGRDEGLVSLVVADNGPGVPLELADDLFTPFATGREDGLGLGLAIARDIARTFGGELEQIESPLGGAGFKLQLRPA